MSVNNAEYSAPRRAFTLTVIVFALLLVFLTTGCGGSSSGETFDYDDPELSSRLTAAFDTWVSERGLYGAAITVESQGFEWSYETGVVLLGEEEPYSTATQQRVGSATKPMTAVVILQLVEEGLLRLDTTMDNYFPDYPNADEITVEMLLRHRSGIYDVTLDDLNFISYVQQNPSTWISVQDLLYWTYDSGGSIPSEINSLSKGELIPREPVCDPGTCPHYSQPGYQVLGYIIESTTGKPVQEVYDERIFEPLGLDGTYIPYPDQMNAPVGYTNVFGLLDSKVPSNAVLSSYNSFNSSALTAGGVVSNVEDLMTFMQALMKGELLSNSSFKLMQDWMFWREDSDASIKRWDYGMGLNRAYHDDGADYQSIRHGGSVPGSGCQMIYFPKWDLYVVLTRNTDRDSVVAGTPEVEERIIRALRDEPQIKDRDPVL